MSSPRSALVFPAGMPASLAWARRSMEEGVRVIGASSVPNDPARNQYSDWTPLPWIGDQAFFGALSIYLTEQRIGTVFTPHAVVWSKLRELLPQLPPGIRLEPASPWATELSDYRAYRDLAARFHKEPLLPATSGTLAPEMPVSQLASLVRTFQLVPGQCDHAKLEALIAIFRLMPQGDVIEIGSFWGRSAVALAYLARHYQIGKLLCVDPWRTEALRQNIPEVDRAFEQMPMDEVFQAFCINLAPFSGQVNYSRACSTEAAARYHSQHRFESTAFGDTPYQGEIALLHIDGNHELNAVRADVDAWRPMLGPRGWIVFDDYCWPFGDGVRTAADEFLRRSESELTTAFVAGGALFAQLR